tara:strand:- start:17787 stop:18515 length:729 start_codon:yes stop_codon:yes gene_type:complete
VAYSSNRTTSNAKRFNPNKNLRLDNDLASDRKPVKVGNENTGLLLSKNEVFVENEPTNDNHVVTKKYADSKTVFLINDGGRWTMSTANDHYGGYPGYYHRATDLTGTLSQGGTDTSAYYYYASRYSYLIPSNGIVSKIMTTCEIQYNTGQQAEITVFYWKVAAQTNQASTTTSVDHDLIGSVVFDNPGDSSYGHAVATCSNIDTNGATFSEGDMLMITASKDAGTDSTYAYIKSAIEFTKRV